MNSFKLFRSQLGLNRCFYKYFCDKKSTYNYFASEEDDNRDTITITFIKPSGERREAKAKEGWNFVEVVDDNNLKQEFHEYGICYGSNWCTSCHIYLKPEDYAKLPEASAAEKLYHKHHVDYIPGTSRLGCQITVTKDMDGLEVRLPKRHGPGYEKD